MGLLPIDSWCSKTNHACITHLLCPNHTPAGAKFRGLFDAQEVLPAKLSFGFKLGIRAFASRKAARKLKRDGQQSRNMAKQSNKNLSKQSNVIADASSLRDDGIQNESEVYPSDNSTLQNSIAVASRNDVLQACTITSGLIAALGLIIRQASHVASIEGLPILDCSAEVSFGFKVWHLELIVGLVIFVSSCRYLLLKTWPDFAESSEAANQQVLTSLEPVDYLLIAFLPGVSEELLFRGALLPLFGTNLQSVLLVAAIFGVLHFGSGRKYSFAVWATLVGFVYGYATVLSSNIIVPMASHALNNLVAGLLWRYTSKSSK